MSEEGRKAYLASLSEEPVYACTKCSYKTTGRYCFLIHVNTHLASLVSLASLSEKKVNESNIDHPSHYNKGKIEVIDFIEDQELNFHLGNVVKYICRKGKVKGKGSYSEDLKKAQWYLDRYIKILEST